MVRLFVLFCLLTALCNFFIVDWYRVPSNSMTPTLKNGDILLTYRYINNSNTWYSLISLMIQKNDILVFQRPTWAPHLQKNHGNTYVKRCVGLPGDTVNIRHQRRFSPALRMPGQVAHMYLFPQDTLFSNWTLSAYGPFWVPKRQKTIDLTPYNVRLYRQLISYESPDLSFLNGTAWMNGTRLFSYTFKHDYYFMLGDNFFQSEDSRFWGCIPDDFLIGKVIWYS